MNKLICPLREGICINDRCAWWVRKSETSIWTCAINAIAENEIKELLPEVSG